MLDIQAYKFAHIKITNTKSISSHRLSFHVQLPPSLDEILCCMLRCIRTREQNDRVHLRKVAMLPWFVWTNEMDDLNIMAKPLRVITEQENNDPHNPYTLHYFQAKWWTPRKIPIDVVKRIH